MSPTGLEGKQASVTCHPAGFTSEPQDFLEFSVSEGFPPHHQLFKQWDTMQSLQARPRVPQAQACRLNQLSTVLTGRCLPHTTQNRGCIEGPGGDIGFPSD